MPLPSPPPWRSTLGLLAVAAAAIAATLLWSNRWHFGTWPLFVAVSAVIAVLIADSLHERRELIAGLVPPELRQLGDKAAALLRARLALRWKIGYLAVFAVMLVLGVTVVGLILGRDR